MHAFISWLSQQLSSESASASGSGSGEDYSRFESAEGSGKGGLIDILGFGLGLGWPTLMVIGIAMFALSTVFSLAIPALKSRKDATTIIAAAHQSAEYIQILDRLFNVDKIFQSQKQPSRHSDSETETHKLFNSRKAFFSKVFRDSFQTLDLADKCKVIHVAGTKGKGSTVSYISSALIANKKKVGVFSSPHLHTARERIRLNKNIISPVDLINAGTSALNILKQCNWPVVIFDQLLATALVFFGKESTEYIVLEAGIGGRFDSTNFVSNPAVCIITSISLDHQSILGETVEEIAWQKAGIIKPNCHVFTPATQLPSVLEVFQRQADEVGATLHIVPVQRDLLDESLNKTLHFDVQVENACLSTAALKHLNLPIPAITKGFVNSFWPCRMESFNYEGQTVLLDGCHNSYSLGEFLNGLRKEYPEHEIVIVFGAGAEKNFDTMMDVVLERTDKLVLVQSSHFKALSEESLLSYIPEDKHDMVYGIDNVPQAAKWESTVGTRVQWLIEKFKLENREKQRLIAVCGSLFVAAEAREFLFTVKPDMFSEHDWVRSKDPPKSYIVDPNPPTPSTKKEKLVKKE